MGHLIASTIPNLISGVSQQPWNVRLPTQAEEQINCSSSVTEFLRRRPATRHIARLQDDASGGMALHSINRDETEQYIVLANETGLRVFDLAGKEKSVTVKESGTAYLAAAKNPDADLRFLTINDHTFVLNRKVVVQKLSTTSPVRAPEALIFIKQASYNTTYTVIINGAGYGFTTADGVAPADQPADSLSSAEIAGNLASQIIAAQSAFTVGVTNSTIWLTRKDGGQFTVKVEDTRSNTHMTCCKGTVQRFSDLPTVAPRGFVTEIVGDASSSFDNYYCVFEPADTGEWFGTGVWKETVKPGIPCQIAPATMPHVLIRQADGTFTFGPQSWEDRCCGDEKSAPFPSFVERTLGGLFFYRNRLAFLAGENVIMSEVGEFFNFFLTTVTTLIDSDVIDVAASHTRDNILEHACVFSGGLLLFSGQSQFVLEHDTVLSNATVSLKPVTEFESAVLAAPVSSGKTVFFAADRGAYGGVREYVTLPDASEQNDAADVTAHVPRYIGGTIRKLVCSTGEDVLLVLSDSKKDSLWLYKYFWNGSEKIQSSWSRWDMCGEIVSVVFLHSTVFLVMRYPGEGLFLESMAFEPGVKDEGVNFEVCLDRKVMESSLTIQPYDNAHRTTTMTLPYKPSSAMLVVDSTGASYTVLSHDDTTLTVRGDVHGKHLFVGMPYRSAYTFGTFAIREDGKGNAVTTGRLQLRTLTLNVADTGFLRCVVTPAFRDPSIHTFTGRELGHGSNLLGTTPLYTGTVKCPILSLNTNVTVAVESDSFLPFALVNASWEGFYNSRHQRM